MRELQGKSLGNRTGQQSDTPPTTLYLKGDERNRLPAELLLPPCATLNCRARNKCGVELLSLGKPFAC
jgi:hypothetical protein